MKFSLKKKYLKIKTIKRNIFKKCYISSLEASSLFKTL